MKLIANIVRVLAGVLFVFSGFIKINDPVGFSIKLEEYLMVFATDLAPKPDTLQLILDIQNRLKMKLTQSFCTMNPKRKLQ